MKPPYFDMDQVITFLQGTCNYNLASALEELYPEMEESDLTEEDLNQLDNELFNCDNCGWWCETSERCWTDGDGDICEDCEESLNEENN